MQQNYAFSEVPLNVLPSVEQYDAASSLAIADTSRGQRSFSKSQSMNSISTTCPSSDLLANLDGQLCLVALEHLLMLVASQSIYVIRSPDLEPRWKQIVRRDISSELLSFHELVRRKVIVDYRDTRCQWVRRKHGLLRLKQAINTVATQRSATSTDVVRRSSSTANELRVNVVRRQHLQHAAAASTSGESNFEMTRVLSPIAGPSNSPIGPRVESSTPQICSEAGETPRAHVVESRKRYHVGQPIGELCLEDELLAIEVQYFPPSTEPGYCELSQVQLVEEDYLQLMSLLFGVIPQTD